MTQIEVLRAGPLTTIQDLGRPGFAHLGVPHCGAADMRSLAQANAAAGNTPCAAALETTLAGPALRFGGPSLIALAGAPARVTLDGAAVPFGEPVNVGTDAVLDIGQTTTGVRTYIAVLGGIDAPPVLGSRSSDMLTGLGPAPLRRGDVLQISFEAPAPSRRGPDTDGTPRGAPSSVGARAVPAGPGSDPTLLRITFGPRADLLAPGAADLITREPFTVSPASNRVGVRLSGPQLRLASALELPSEGLLRGAIQLPAGGDPIVMLADHPVTGGYPVIAVVALADLPLLGQLRPGTEVRFTASSA